ncbi:hypothetical protein LZ30DRAFT_735412 [Colletotrichum cereale]|nr:hypothetical protein LZ30DRAFT_735412 [Colletotrichum cereale]
MVLQSTCGTLPCSPPTPPRLVLPDVASHYPQGDRAMRRCEANARGGSTSPSPTGTIPHFVFIFFVFVFFNFAFFLSLVILSSSITASPPSSTPPTSSLSLHRLLSTCSTGCHPQLLILYCRRLELPKSPTMFPNPPNCPHPWARTGAGV